MSNPHRKARRNKRYIPRWRKEAPMIVSASFALGPIEAIVEQLEHGDGTVHTDAGGTPIFQPTMGSDWYPMVPAILGVVDLFETWAARRDRNLPLEPLRQLARRLKYGMPITEVETAAARRIFPVLRRVSAFFDRDEADDLIRITQIKELMEARAA